MADYTAVLRDLEAIQSQLDKIFKRVNPGPVFETEKQLRDAVSDNVRYYAEDRKADLAEILFALFDVIYDRIVKQDMKDPFCNPQIEPSEGTARLPEVDMFRRIVMPLSWAMNAKWPDAALTKTMDAYTASFTPEETKIVYQSLDFLFSLFPEFSGPATEDVLAYWKAMDSDRESMRNETDEEKSHLLDLLMQKRAGIRK